MMFRWPKGSYRPPIFRNRFPRPAWKRPATNMKFALNGALTIGTLDGANIEIKDRVGDDNIVIFGLTAEEVAAKRANGYQPRAVIEASRELSQALAAIASGVFSPDDPSRYADLIAGIYDH